MEPQARWFHLLSDRDDLRFSSRYAAFFCFAFHAAQRALWAAAIFCLAAADIVRRAFGEPARPVPLVELNP